MNEMTFTELQKAIEAELKFQYPNDDIAMTYARMLGLLLAYADKPMLTKILENRKQECARCGQDVLPSTHPEIGCDA